MHLAGFNGTQLQVLEALIKKYDAGVEISIRYVLNLKITCN